MEFLLGQLIKAVIFPPGIFIVLIIIALCLFKYNDLAAKRLLKLTAFFLYLISLPITSELLLSPLEPYPALNQETIQGSSAKAIVILSAGRFRHAAEYENQDVSGDNGFGRLKYGVKLHKLTNLPILITGGLSDEEKLPLGELMARDLVDNFEIEAKWQENQSKNTAENAKFSREMLLKESISEIFLVTDAWHMPRAVYIFEKQGFSVTPAPTRFKGLNQWSFELEVASFLPSTSALTDSYFAMHEMIGFIWYKIRY